MLRVGRGGGSLAEISSGAGNPSGSRGRVQLSGPGGIWGDLVRGDEVGVGRRCLRALPSGVQDPKEVFGFSCEPPLGETGEGRVSISAEPSLGKRERAEMLRVRCFPENLSGLCRGGRAPTYHSVESPALCYDVY